MSFIFSCEFLAFLWKKCVFKFINNSFFFVYIYDTQFTQENLKSTGNLKTYVPGSKQKNKKEN